MLRKNRNFSTGIKSRADKVLEKESYLVTGNQASSDFTISFKSDESKNKNLVNDEMLSKLYSSNNKGTLHSDEKLKHVHYSSHERENNPSKSGSSSSNAINNLTSIIYKARNLRYLPPIYIYDVSLKEEGVSAVDVDQNMFHLAYSPAHSCEIHLLSRNNLCNNFNGDLSEMWSEYIKFRGFQNRRKKRKTSEDSLTAQLHCFGHTTDVSGLRFSLDSNLLLSCFLDGSVKVIDTNSYHVVNYYSGLGFSADIDLSSDSTSFAVASAISKSLCDNYKVLLYSIEQTQLVSSFSGHKGVIKCVRFHPNGLYLATSCSDNTVKLWNVRTATEVRNFEDKGKDPPEKVAFSPDGKYLASTHSGHVKIWDLASGKKLKWFETSNSEFNLLNVCYNSTGDILATGGSDNKIQLWDMRNENSEIKSHCNLLESESLDKRVFSLKYITNFFSCVTA